MHVTDIQQITRILLNNGVILTLFQREMWKSIKCRGTLPNLHKSTCSTTIDEDIVWLYTRSTGISPMVST